MQFRKDINGLRALAVLAVVLFHFDGALLPGGFVGVDVFFVISGFLMTGIIFRGLMDNSFSVLGFYVSRAKRIVPALSLVCLVAFFVGFFCLYDVEFKDALSQIISAVLFVSNFYFWETSNYFSPGAETKILLHTWSLSVEWQFYIIYPLVLICISKVTSPRGLKVAIFMGFTISFIFSIYASPRWMSSSYYLLPTRGWEMLLGGLAFFVRFDCNKRLSKSLSFFALILIVLSCFFVSKNDPWPGYLAVVPVLSVFVILVLNSNIWPLTGNVAQLVGKYSYSIYLWHWIVVFLLYRYTDMGWVIFGCFVSLFFGFLSYEFIEKRGFGWVNRVIIFLAFTLPVVCIVYFDAVNQFRPISKTQNNELVSYYSDRINAEVPWVDNLCSGDNPCGQGGVLLWGDSHARALYYGLNSSGFADLTVLTASSCAPSLNYPNYKLKSRIACNENNLEALRQVSLKKPDVVVLTRRYHHEETDWETISSRLIELGARKVLVVGPVLQFNGELPLLVARKYFNKVVVNWADIDKSIFISNEKMQSMSNRSYEYIDVLSDFCDLDGCFFQTVQGDNSKLLTFDYGHLTKDGSKFIVNKFLDVVIN